MALNGKLLEKNIYKEIPNSINNKHTKATTTKAISQPLTGGINLRAGRTAKLVADAHRLAKGCEICMPPCCKNKRNIKIVHQNTNKPSIKRINMIYQLVTKNSQVFYTKKTLRTKKGAIFDQLLRKLKIKCHCETCQRQGVAI